ATTVDEFVGRLLLDASGTYWVDGVLVQAMRSGEWILLDEINACLPEIAFCLHSLLDDDRMIVLTEHDGSVVQPAEGFRLFATMNPTETGRYGGTRPLNEGLLDRFPVVMRLEYLPFEEEVDAAMAQSGNHDRATVERMVRVAADVRDAIRHERLFGSFSTRRLVEWARMARAFDPVEAARATVLQKYSPEDARLVEDVIALFF
ncbi:MAG: AAA family ATPase, partial [Actinobacteria bacterium]|nr:AAA family ATPase [Actinomycetota bacterium]